MSHDPSVDSRVTSWAGVVRRTRISASHVNDGDSLEVADDGRLPASSADTSIPRFTWRDRRGTAEWIQYNQREVRELSRASVDWFDDTGSGLCRMPSPWRVRWLDGETWRPVDNITPYDVARDRLNTTTLTPDVLRRPPPTGV